MKLNEPESIQCKPRNPSSPKSDVRVKIFYSPLPFLTSMKKAYFRKSGEKETVKT
jgi:hypothetical protein